MLRALPKSQQARWLEIGRAFERVQRPARPGEHVAFIPVAEAGTTGRIPTRFSARTARIPSALRPTSAEAAVSSPETSEAPSSPIAAAPAPSPAPLIEEPVAATTTLETATWTEPKTPPPPSEPMAVAVTETVPTADDAPAPKLADFLHEELPLRRRATPGAGWGGWSSYAAGKDFVPDESAPTPPDSLTTAAPPAAEVTPAPSSLAEHHADGGAPRVSAIEFFRAAPW